MEHAAFRNPPIVEAVVAARFASPGGWSSEVLQTLEGAIRALYSGDTRQEMQIQLQTRLKEGQATTTTASAPRRLLFRASDGSGLVGLAPGLLTVHVLQPYPGWMEFKSRVHEAVALVANQSGAEHLLELAIRYIDRIAIPTGAEAGLSDYFTSIPARPTHMPEQLTAFQSITEARDPETGTVAVLTTAAVPPLEGESFALLYDLNLFRLYPEGAALPLADYQQVLEELHERQYRIFMDSVTDRTKELFA